MPSAFEAVGQSTLMVPMAHAQLVWQPPAKKPDCALVHCHEPVGELPRLQLIGVMLLASVKAELQEPPLLLTTVPWSKLIVMVVCPVQP